MTTLLCVMTHAQQRFVVIDMETKVPLRDVTVKCASGITTTSKWDGSFLLDTTSIKDTTLTKGRALTKGTMLTQNDTLTKDKALQRSDSTTARITLSKPGYLERVTDITQLTDTIELLPAFNKLAEVVVWGVYRPRTISFTLRPPTEREIAETKGPPTGASVGIGDVMLGIENLLSYKKRKRTKKTKENISRY